MAHEPDQSPRAQSLLTLGALALMLSAAALAFGRVFTGGGATLRLVLAALASVGLATLLERRNLLIATIASAGLLLVAIALLVFPHTTLYGIPTSRTLAAVADAIGRVREQARVQVSPTVPLPPLFLAAVTAMWAAAFSAHALLARAGSPILAMLPPVALVGFADTVLDDGGRPFFAVLVLLGVLTVVLTDGVRRMRLWGPIWPWQGRGGRHRRIPARGATRVAVIAIGVAALLPGLLPGFGAGALVDLGSSSDSGHINPFVSIEATLKEKVAEPLFLVQSPVKSYWRILSLDRFDPETSTWQTADLRVQHGQTISSASSLPGVPPLAGMQGGEPTLVTQTITMLKDLPEGNTWLPMAYAPQSVALGEGAFRFDPALTTAFAIDPVEAGSRYTVISRIPAPTREELEGVRVMTPPGGSPDTQLPPELADVLDTIAADIVRNAQAVTPFDQVLAIQNYFQGPQFSYNLDVDYGDQPDAVLDFLREKEGFCQQFASAMTLLVRSLGYPARVAVGYRPGSPSSVTTGAYSVTSDQFHSWVEVNFPNYGWIAFEPTPDFKNPVAASSYLSVPTGPSSCPGQDGCGKGSASTGKGDGRGTQGGGLPRSARGPNGVGSRGRAFHGGSGPVPIAAPERRFPAGTLLRIALLLGLAVLVLTPPVRASARAVRVRRARGAREMVLAEYRAFTERAADLGFPRAPGETIEEYRRSVEAGVRLSNGHLTRVSAAAERAAYGLDEPAEEDAGALRSDARVALKDVRRSVGLARRVRGLYRPEL